MHLWYRLSNARYVERLYRQQDFEMMFGPLAMKAARAIHAARRTISSTLRETP